MPGAVSQMLILELDAYRKAMDEFPQAREQAEARWAPEHWATGPRMGPPARQTAARKKRAVCSQAHLEGSPSQGNHR
jgi:hypothetical protein